jgi:protein-S-isoprenylcysteine O-methyltransferase Ste14
MILLLFVVFGISHSILASNKIKEQIVEKVGNKIAFYRLFYNLSSLIIFLALYEIAPKPNLVIYDLPYPWDLIIFGLQVISLAGLIWSVLPVDLKEFLGISQIIRWWNGNYKLDELDEHKTFIVKGAFKYSRHPIYFFTILFLGLRPTMDLFYLTVFLCITAYFIIGSFYEEDKLVEHFGESYKKYQQRVPRLIPIKLTQNKSY